MPPKGGPRWFSPYDLSYGTRIDYPNRQIVPLRDIQKSEGLSWSVHVPALKNYSDNTDDPIRSPIVVLEDAYALGPPHSSHAAIKLTAAELSRIGARIRCFPPLTAPIQTTMADLMLRSSRTIVTLRRNEYSDECIRNSRPPEPDHGDQPRGRVLLCGTAPG